MNGWSGVLHGMGGGGWGEGGVQVRGLDDDVSTLE